MTNEEMAQFRSYLASQSMKRTPVQLYDRLQEVYQQFLAVLDKFPESTSDDSVPEGAWTLSKIVEHVSLFMATYERAICMLLEQNQQPPDFNDRSEIPPGQQHPGRLELLAALQSSVQHLEHTVYQAEPDAHLKVTWQHFELGAMHWREWLLLARVHLLDHVRQIQAM